MVTFFTPLFCGFLGLAAFVYMAGTAAEEERARTIDRATLSEGVIITTGTPGAGSGFGSSMGGYV